MDQIATRAVSAYQNLQNAHVATQMAKVDAPVSRYQFEVDGQTYVVVEQPVPVTRNGKQLHFGKDGMFFFNSKGEENPIKPDSTVYVAPKAVVQTPEGATYDLQDFYSSVQRGQEDELITGSTIDDRVEFIGNFNQGLKSAPKQDITKRWASKFVKDAKKDIQALGKNSDEFYKALESTDPALFNSYQAATRDDLPSLEFLDSADDVSIEGASLDVMKGDDDPHLDFLSIRVTDQPGSYFIEANIKAAPDKTKGDYKLQLKSDQATADIEYNSTTNRVKIKRGASETTLDNVVMVDGNRLYVNLDKSMFPASSLGKIDLADGTARNATRPEHYDRLRNATLFDRGGTFNDGIDGISDLGGHDGGEILSANVTYDSINKKTKVDVVFKGPIQTAGQFSHGVGLSGGPAGGGASFGYSKDLYGKIQGPVIAYADLSQDNSTDNVKVSGNKINLQFDRTKIKTDVGDVMSISSYSQADGSSAFTRDYLDSATNIKGVKHSAGVPPETTPITLRLSKGEQLWPTTPLKHNGVGDDADASNNRKNFEDNRAPFIVPGNKAAVWRASNAKDGYNYEVQATYWTDNPMPVPFDTHQHDVEYAIIKKDSNNDVIEVALSNHLGFVYPAGADLTDVVQNGVRVEQFGHAYMSGNTKGLWQPGINVASSQQQIQDMTPAVDADRDSLSRYKGGKGRDAPFGGENGEYFGIIGVFDPEKVAIAEERAKVMTEQSFIQRPWEVFENKDKYKATKVGSLLNLDSGAVESTVVRDGKVLGEVGGQVKGEIPVSRYWKDGTKTFAITPDRDSNLGKFKFEVYGLQDSKYDLTLLLTDKETEIVKDQTIKAGQKHSWTVSDGGTKYVGIDADGNGAIDCTRKDYATVDCSGMDPGTEAVVIGGAAAAILAGIVGVAGVAKYRNRNAAAAAAYVPQEHQPKVHKPKGPATPYYCKCGEEVAELHKACNNKPCGDCKETMQALPTCPDCGSKFDWSIWFGQKKTK